MLSCGEFDNKTCPYLYGAPQVFDRMTVWSKISDILASYSNVVLVGDFNQVEYLPDKYNTRILCYFINYKI